MELFPLKRNNNVFDVKKFYVDLIAYDEEDISL